MTIPAQPVADLSILEKTDGSASYSQNGYSIIGSVNGPIEVQRRDEIPDEAAIDVIVRPAHGPGGWFGYTYKSYLTKATGRSSRKASRVRSALDS